MAELLLIVAMAAITFASRASYLLRGRRPAAEGRASPFLDAFPLSLFVALATVGLAAPHGRLALGPSLAAAAGGVVGAVVGRRAIVAVVVGGALAYWLARSIM